MNIILPSGIFSRLLPKLTLCWLLLAGYAVPAHAQFKVQQAFENTTATGWTLSYSAFLTAPSIDAAGSGWLRLTNAVTDEKGLALNNAFTVPSNTAVVVEFNYVAWGGSGADGMTLFLYDPTVASPMSGAVVGGGLGYCGGSGGYLAIGLDEYGNFSNPHDRCLTASEGPGFKPESLVIRGPESASNAWVSTTAVPGGIDNPHVTTRPAAKTVLMSLTPAVGSNGYTITVQYQSAAGQPFQTLLSNAAFPYAAPNTLAVGFSGATGGSTNNHELHGLVAASPDDLQVSMAGPSSVLQGGAVTYTITVTNNGNYAISSANAPTVADSVPAVVTSPSWTCAGAGGATCAASGTGSIDTSNLTLPANGSVTYTLTGTLNSGATCGSTVVNSANADFGSGSPFLDPNETNNTSAVDSTVTCDVTLVANPTSLSFGPQTVNVPSSSQSITVTEGTNAATITGISASGGYSQTNDCPTAMAATHACTINVVFTPSAEGSSNGTVTILSNAASSPTVTTVVALTGTGTNSVPTAFSLTALNNVDLSSVQTSNAITVANTNVPSPISVSDGAQYSINGGAFTSVPGVVSPGAQVAVQVTAASAYSTAVDAVLTIGGVDSTFTVTTGTQPVLQGALVPVTAAAPASVQTSNPITVSGTSVPAAISISSGARYSIDGGAFTSTPGVVQPDDTVRVQVTTPADYNTTDSAVLTIGAVQSTFTVTTAAQPALQAGFTPVSSTAPSTLLVSNAITVTGTLPVPISVSSGAQYSINGGPFTAAAGSAAPGDSIRLQVTAPSAYSTTESAVLTIGAVEARFSITTAAKLQNVVVTAGGGGAMGTVTLLFLALCAGIRVVGSRHVRLALPMAVLVLGALCSAPVWADDGNWQDDLYDGIRVGGSSSSMTAAKLTAGLQADGFEVSAADATRSTLSGTLYVGYELSKDFGVELGWTYIDRLRAELAGLVPPDLNRLLGDAAYIVRGAGNMVSLEGRYRLNVAPRLAIDLRGGPYLWITKTDVYVSGVDELSRTQTGTGGTLGVGPRYALTPNLGFGVSADFFASSSESHFWRASATAEYRF